MNNKNTAEEISIAVCFDENYALNGAMTLYSTVKNVREGTNIKAYVIDGGIKEKTKKRFEKIAKDNLEIIWLNPDLSVFDNLPVSSWTTKSTHSRLLLPDIIPEDITKILYLDSDMLVLKDITCLWDIPLNGNILLAVQNSKYPYVHTKPDSKSLIDAGMNPSSPYFGAGLLLIDIPQWRKFNLLSGYLKLLNEMGNSFTHRNQDPMNIILENKWGLLDQRWQVLSSCFNSSDKEHRRMAQDAFILHFTGTAPGFAGCRHPKKALFYEYVYSSGWFSKMEYFSWRLKLLIKRIGYIIGPEQYKLLKKLLKKDYLL